MDNLQGKSNVQARMPSSEMNSSIRRRLSFIVSTSLWLFGVVIWLLATAVDYLTGCPAFLDQASSPDGDVTEGWNWLPPGRVCTYAVGGATHTDGVPFTQAIIAAIFAVWLVSIVLAHLIGRGGEDSLGGNAKS